MLSQTRMTQQTQQAVQETIQRKGWDHKDVMLKLQKSMSVLEERNRKIAARWMTFLS
jgi:ribosome-binding protein aMBF1 (putative translation factor)